VVACIRACNLVGKYSMVRVPSHEAGWITRVLDAGADGIIVPQVDTAEEARQAVKAARFPPVGKRSYGGRRIIDLEGRGYSDTANEDTLLMAQLETPDALVAANEIAAVEGVDILLAGPDDMALTLGGISMNAPKPMDKMREWQTAVSDACRTHGKFYGAIGASTDLFALYSGLGAAMIACAADVGFIASGSEAAASAARQSVKSDAPTEKGAPDGSVY
jgi:2-keto-3-deoxy-L-rhamnonate aldolase RhmA